MSYDIPTAERNLDGYDAPMIPWAQVRQALEGPITQAPDTGGPNRHTTWLATTNPDGTPHVVPVGAVWNEGIAYFSSGLAARKARNIEADARCSLSIATHPYDLTVEGRAVRVTDDETLHKVAGLFATWGPEVRDGAFFHEFSAPSAGPPPWYLHAITPETVFAFGTAEPYGAARFDLQA